MYQLDWVAQIRTSRSLRRALIPQLVVSQTAWRLGFTSLLTDVSSEMVSSILPLYFVLYLHFSPLAFGFLDGISQGAAVAFLSLFSGILADRWRLQKEVAVAGYALSALSKVGLLIAGNSWTFIAGILALDRVGKGIRTSSRDAMISLTNPSDRLATAFAVHRGLDTCGAVFGPLAAFLLLRLVTGAFDLVLMASFCIALAGLGVITLLVDKPPSPTTPAQREMPSLQLSLGLLIHPGFRALVIAGGTLGFFTISDAFIYLLLQEKTHSDARSLPLYAFLTAVFYLLFSIPAGRLADARGRWKVFIGGYAALALSYAILLGPGMGNQVQFVVVGLLGVYYAATDGVLAAMASASLPAELRTSGLALLNTASSLSRLVSSVLFGWLWTSRTSTTAVWAFQLCLLAAISMSAAILTSRRRV
jgi:MFS family permease